MKVYQGKTVVSGEAEGLALVTDMPVNFTAAFTKPVNFISSRRSEIRDEHHDLFKQRVRNTVLFFPTCIGSSYTGMMLLQLLYENQAPAAVVVQNADSLLVSGAILGEVWFRQKLPIIEYKEGDLFKEIRTGDFVQISGDNAEIVIR